MAYKYLWMLILYVIFNCLLVSLFLLISCSVFQLTVLSWLGTDECTVSLFITVLRNLIMFYLYFCCYCEHWFCWTELWSKTHLRKHIYLSFKCCVFRFERSYGAWKHPPNQPNYLPAKRSHHETIRSESGENVGLGRWEQAVSSYQDVDHRLCWDLYFCVVDVLLFASCLHFLDVCVCVCGGALWKFVQRDSVMKATLFHFEALLWCVAEVKDEAPLKWRAAGLSLCHSSLKPLLLSPDAPFPLVSVVSLFVRLLICCFLSLLPHCAPSIRGDKDKH